MKPIRATLVRTTLVRTTLGRTTLVRAMLAATLAALPATLASVPAKAHPHVFIEVSNELQFDDTGKLVAIRATWRFDEFYSAFAVEGMDKDGDGAPDADGLAELARQNMAALPEYNYFTDVVVDGVNAETGEARDALNTFADMRLTLSFTLPLADPVDPRLGQVEVVTYDPTYYIAMDPAPEAAVALAGAPAGCTGAFEAAGEAETLADAIAQTDLDLARTFALNAAPRLRLRCG